MENSFLQLKELMNTYVLDNWQNWLIISLTTLFKLIAFILVFYFIKVLMQYIVQKGFSSYMVRSKQSSSRSKTLYALLKNSIQYIFYFIILYGCLSILGFPVSTLLAGAGIAGVAIGLGAKDFLTDVVNGFFILLEHQFDVGDDVTFGGISGIVANVGIRSAKVIGFDGTTYYIPNREIMIVSNHSQSDMRATMDINILPQTSIEDLRRVIDQVNQKVIPTLSNVQRFPEHLGVLYRPNGQLYYRVVCFVIPGEQYAVQNKLMEAYVEALHLANVSLPQSNPIAIVDQ
ncbi:mechanosensitive ion channel family protein [Atopobacter phocae]|uniref:mechanosensitive ion channel family protein n=1 Tax=Atopobacter phocae TaxID=136492 RepID=UPI0004BA69C7|nr:mechanosensitive ion channel domain-containing protein [Atopobacter phocae]